LRDAHNGFTRQSGSTRARRVTFEGGAESLAEHGNAFDGDTLAHNSAADLAVGSETDGGIT
jgi:hypothetical protein